MIPTGRLSNAARLRAVAVIAALPIAFCVVGCTDDAADNKPQTKAPIFDVSGDDTNTQPATQPQIGAVKAHFVDGEAQTGIRFKHEPHRTPERYSPETFSGGVVIIDVNRDGAPDVLLLGGGSMLENARPADSINRLFVNDGKGRFTDQTETWQVPSPGFGMGAAVGDFDNDGWTDLYLTGYGADDVLLRNTGTSFEDVTASAKLTGLGTWSTSAGFFDMDADGDLDLYVASYVKYSIDSAFPCRRGDRNQYCTPSAYESEPDHLFRNNGDGTFTDVSHQVVDRDGNPIVPCNGLALAIGDIDGDGDQDIYVANDLTQNYMLINDGSGNFHDVGHTAGVAFSKSGEQEAGMGADFSDLDGDSLLDIVCTNFQGETTSVYQQRDRFTFREVSDSAGVGYTARSRLSFGVEFFDADNDGDEDLMTANGHIQDTVRYFAHGVTFEQLNTLWQNDGGRLTDITAQAGPAFESKYASRSLVTADLDSDGDVDYIVNNNGGPAQVALSEPTDPGAFIGLCLEGVKANRSAIGARVEVAAGPLRYQRQVMGATSYLSVSDFRVHLGLGEQPTAERIVIHWPGGEAQAIEGLEAGRYYYVKQGKPPVAFVPGKLAEVAD